MVIDLVARRITELAKAFAAFAATVPGLRVEVVGHMNSDRALVHPVAGFHVHVQEAEGLGGVQLYVSANYAELIRWGDAGAIRERFTVQLDDGFRWGDSRFPDAAALAHDLVAYMHYKLDALAAG